MWWTMVAHGGNHWFSKASAVAPLVLTAVALCTAAIAGGVKHTVGDTIWSIPPTNDLYNTWSSSRAFHPGDVLHFEFESEMYNVMQVSGTDYHYCEWDTLYIAWRPHNEGPALIPLTNEGHFYYICNFLNYCSLGMKLAVYVNQTTTPSIKNR